MSPLMRFNVVLYQRLLPLSKNLVGLPLKSFPDFQTVEKNLKAPVKIFCFITNEKLKSFFNLCQHITTLCTNFSIYVFDNYSFVPTALHKFSILIFGVDVRAMYLRICACEYCIKLKAILTPFPYLS